MKIITVASLKGGAGKTALAVFLAREFARRGSRVLVADLDHNNNATDHFLRDVEPDEIERRNVHHVLRGDASVRDCVHASENGGPDVLPCTLTLSRAGLEMAHDPGAVLRFGPDLRRLQYDYVLIDTPPALCFELTTGLYAAGTVLCPVCFSRWTVQGYAMLLEEVERVKRALGRSPELLAVPSIVTEKQAESLRETGLGRITTALISRGAGVRGAADKGVPLRANTKSDIEFQELATEIAG